MIGQPLFSMFLPFRRALTNVKPVLSVTLSSYLFFCLPFPFSTYTIPCRIIFASPVDLVMRPYRLNLLFLIIVRSSEQIFIGPNSKPDSAPHFTICNMSSIGNYNQRHAKEQWSLRISSFRNFLKKNQSHSYLKSHVSKACMFFPHY